MKKLLPVLLMLFIVHDLFAQKQKAFFEIADKKIVFEYEEKMIVWRTVTDTIVSCKEQSLKNYPLGTNTTYAKINPSEFKILHREVFKENSCVWTRLTNDVIKEDEKAHFIDLNFINDSACFFKLPLSCYRHDTVMQINPITLEEVMAVTTDSIEKHSLI